MPRRKAVPSYCRHKATDRAYVKIRGRRIYLGRWNSRESKDEYRRVIEELSAQPEATPLSRSAAAKAVPDLTINEVADSFLTHVDAYYRKPDGRPTSEPGVIRIALGVICTIYGDTPASEFGPKALKTVRHAMLGRGWARRSINKHMNRVVRLFKWATENEIVNGSIFHALRAVEGLRPGRSGAREPAPIRPVDDATVAATLPKLSRVVAAMVRVQRLTGMRPGEVCQMRPCDVDRSRAVWIYTPPTHKAEHHGKGRLVCIGPKAQEILKPFLDERSPEAPVFSPADAAAEMRAARSLGRRTPMNQGNRPGTNRKPIAMIEPRRAYSTCSYSRAVRRACERVWPTSNEDDDPNPLPAEVLAANAARHWHPNQLRHAAATEFRREFGLEAAQVLLGHSKADVTQVYAERDAAKAVEIARRVG